MDPTEKEQVLCSLLPSPGREAGVQTRTVYHPQTTRQLWSTQQLWDLNLICESTRTRHLLLSGRQYHLWQGLALSQRGVTSDFLQVRSRWVKWGLWKAVRCGLAESVRPASPWEIPRGRGAAVVVGWEINQA